MLNLRSANSQSCIDPVMGFTLIELMIVIAIIAIIFTLGPSDIFKLHDTYKSRKSTFRHSSCQNRNHGNLPVRARYCFIDELIGQTILFETSNYIEKLDISGSCSRPVITITNRNTGAH